MRRAITAACPFCGETMELDLEVRGYWDYEAWRVWCRECKASGPERHLRKEAIKAWNERHKSPEATHEA